jgi:hypothetical protein
METTAGIAPVMAPLDVKFHDESNEKKIESLALIVSEIIDFEVGVRESSKSLYFRKF